MVHLPSLRSRMTGGYLVSFYKKLFSLSTHACPFRRLPPPPQPWQSVTHTFAALLRSAKSGSLASRQTGTAFYVIHFSILWFDLYKKYNFFLPQPLLPPNAEGSAELREAKGACLCTQVRIVFLAFCSLLPLPKAFYVRYFHIFRFHS